MTLLNLWYRIVPHRCKYGRARIWERKGFTGEVISKYKICRLCATTKPVRARGRKSA